MAYSHISSEVITDTAKYRPPYLLSQLIAYSGVDLLYMRRSHPSISLRFIMNRSMNLVGYQRAASLFFQALSGALDYNYKLAREKLLHVAAQHGEYYYSFWDDITHRN